jgi:pimeloyl-ACP methyl ester carboxylesterase
VEGAHEDLARGWPDTVALSGVAAAAGRPVLLTLHGQLPEATRAAMRSLGDVDPNCATVRVRRSAMATFVLVHGGWGGGWEWERVAGHLRTAGHHVHTPTLTGLGDRAHLASREVGLATHVRDVVATIVTLDLDDAILVGQSYGGMVVTGAVDHVPARIRRLVYLDAFVPTDGISCNTLCGPEWTARMRALADSEGNGWLVPLPFSGTMGLPDEIAAWYIPRLVPQPLATLDDPAELTDDGAAVPRTYVRFLDQAGEQQDDPLRGSAERARDAGWSYVEEVAPHDLHVSDPERMARLLAAVVEGTIEA